MKGSVNVEIPAKNVCDQLEGQIEKLRVAISEENRQSIAEHVAVIEAYCQLLKSPSNIEKTKTQLTYVQVNQKEYAVPTQGVTTTEQDVKGRNLLDF